LSILFFRKYVGNICDIFYDNNGTVKDQYHLLHTVAGVFLEKYCWMLALLLISYGTSNNPGIQETAVAYLV